MNIRFFSLLALAGCTVFGVSCAGSGTSERSGNPIFEGWYADPEAVVYDGTCWVYPTSSLPYDEQLSFDCFSSDDLVHWTKHTGILKQADVAWARRAMWAPAAIRKDGRYYFFFAANDVHEGEVGGIGVAVSDRPEGPYRDLLGKPLIGEIVNGAQPIDQFVYEHGGEYYMYYGGWGHCNVVRLKEDFTGIRPFDDGELYKEITPERYTEGPFLFERIGTIMRQDPAVATGAGHHSVIRIPGTDDYYIVYHRHPLGDGEGAHRQVCIERMTFDAEGRISPVRLTFEGVEARDLSRNL